MSGAMKAAASLFSLLARRTLTNVPRTVELGGHRVDLPAQHLFDWYRFRHRRYDEPVADICSILVDKYRSFAAIDIGANIGVTAAQMARTESVRILCVEGNEKFIPCLAKNLARASPASEIARCYVGAEDAEISGAVRSAFGTAAIEVARTPTPGGPTVRLRSLAAILDEHEAFRAARLVKVDTDGFDAKIVVGSKDLLARMRPVLFVEYTPVGEPGAGDEYYAMIETLGEIGYRWFHVFDNFGNHMLRLSFDERSHLRELGAYVRSSRKDAKPAVFYFDVCALTDDDRDVSDRLVSRFLFSNP